MTGGFGYSGFSLLGEKSIMEGKFGGDVKMFRGDVKVCGGNIKVCIGDTKVFGDDTKVI